MARLSVTSLLWTPIAAESFADVPTEYRDAILVTQAVDGQGVAYPVIVGEAKKRGKKEGKKDV